MMMTQPKPPQLTSLPPLHLLHRMMVTSLNWWTGEKCLKYFQVVPDIRGIHKQQIPVLLPFPWWSSSMTRHSCRVTAPFSVPHIYNNTCLHGSLGIRLCSTPHLQFRLAFHFVYLNNTIGPLWSSSARICLNSSSSYNISIPSDA